MGRNLLFIILCIGIIWAGSEALKPVEKVEITKVSRESVSVDNNYDDNVVSAGVFVTEKPVLIYFYTTWCGGCKQFSPYWDDIVRQYGDKYTCLKINVEDSKYRKIVNEFNIRGIPQVYVYDKATKKRHRLKVTTNMSADLDKYYKKYGQ